MQCTHPLYAINYGYDRETGKSHVKIAPKRVDRSSLQDLERVYGFGNVLTLPCGHCLACKVNYSKEWSIRCMLESSLYKENWFLTLTYDDEHLPSDKKISINHIQLFLKKLRHKMPGLRFFCCGEYGSSTHRPHYHLILFNAHIPDLKCISHGRLGGYYFDSKLIYDTWSYGQITIGEVTPQSCEYVARYCIKKVFGDEFLTMSNRPGIGAQYLIDHLDAIYDTDGVYVKGKKYKVPRYFDKLLERINNPLFCAVKFTRIKDMNKRLALLTDAGVSYDEELYARDNIVNIGKFKDKLQRRKL